MPRRRRRSASKEHTLKVLPLGGLGEIGKNMLVLETDDDIVVIDAGLLFPALEMMGVDVVIPNTDYLVERAEKIRAILITHGHEDHVGALPFASKVPSWTTTSTKSATLGWVARLAMRKPPIS